MRVKQVKELMKARGWVSVDVAAYWSVSATYLSAVINDSARGSKYDCAFRGLPIRDEVVITRQRRHLRKSVRQKSVELNPVGVILVALNNKYVGEDDRVVVVDSTYHPDCDKALIIIRMRRLTDDGPDPYVFSLSDEEVTLAFGDTGLVHGY